MQRIFNYGDIPIIRFTTDKELNILIYRLPSYLKMVLFLTHPVCMLFFSLLPLVWWINIYIISVIRQQVIVWNVNRKPSIITKKASTVKRHINDKLKVSIAEILGLPLASCPPVNVHLVTHGNFTAVLYRYKPIFDQVQCALKRLCVGTRAGFTKFGEIMQSNGHYAVQGHLKSPILVTIESLYTTSC